MNFSDKLDEAEETKLESIPGRASKGVQEVFQSVYGELLLHDEPDAPDRNDYDGQEQGYERYLYDLHEWALEGYEEALDELVDTTDSLDDRDYPELGMHRLEDEQAREHSGDDIIAAREELREVIEWRKKLERIEEAFGDRP